MIVKKNDGRRPLAFHLLIPTATIRDSPRNGETRNKPGKQKDGVVCVPKHMFGEKFYGFIKMNDDEYATQTTLRVRRNNIEKTADETNHLAQI